MEGEGWNAALAASRAGRETMNECSRGLVWSIHSWPLSLHEAQQSWAVQPVVSRRS